MKILFIEWDSFGKEDIKEAFCAEGHELILFPVSMEEDLDDAPELEERLRSILRQETPAVVFSINYFPAVSNVCNRVGSGIFHGFMMRHMYDCTLRWFLIHATRFMYLTRNCVWNFAMLEWIRFITFRWQSTQNVWIL